MMPVTTKGAVGAIGAVASVLSVGVAGCASYLAVVTTAALATSRNVRSDLPDRADSHRFAVFVPAHNEAQVIEQSVSALLALDYPTDQFTVHVVADNCTDATAEIVRRVGARVHERTDIDQPGKGHALNWLFDRVSAIEPFDAVVIVDADTIVDPSFLTEMDNAMAEGSVAAQGRYDVIEASASTAASIRSAALACRHHLRPMGRNALGGSSGLYGNGMAFHHSVLSERRWSGHLVEDAEFQNELLIDGLRVDYIPNARVFAEMPDTLEASVTQNERWELGRLQVARRYVPSLLRLAATGERNLSAARLDAAIDHIVPPMSILVSANGLAGTFASAAALLRGSARDRRSVLLCLASAAAIVAHVLVALRMAGAPRSTYRALASAPRAVAWKVTLWVRVLLRGDDVDWVRTQRNERDPQ